MESGAITPVLMLLSAARDGGAGEQDGETGGGLEEAGVWLSQYPCQTPGESISTLVTPNVIL